MTPNVSLPMYDLPEMWADNARFGEALRGLLRAHDWGLITVEFSEREDGIWLSVEDIGIGMSEAVLTGSLLDFGAPPGWSRDFPASRRKEWFPLDQVWYRLFLCGAVPIRSLWFLPDSRGAVPRPSTSLEDIGYVRGHIRRISVRMGRKIWASRFVHKAGCQNARHGSSPQLQRRTGTSARPVRSFREPHGLRPGPTYRREPLGTPFHPHQILARAREASPSSFSCSASREQPRPAASPRRRRGCA